MAGKFDRFILTSALCAVCLVCNPPFVHAEKVHGKSRNLGITFEVAGGANWCKPDVNIDLKAQSAATFQPDTVPFLQMIGRIRAVVLAQCPNIEVLRFDATAGQQVTFAAEMSRLTRWRRFIRLDPVTQRPLCPDAIDGTCAERVDAFLLAQKVMRGDNFADTEVVNASEGDDHDLSLRSGPVVGKLRIATRADELAGFSTAAQFASAIVSDIGNACTKDGGNAVTAKTRSFGTNLARSETACRQAKGATAKTIVLVWATNDRFRVFSLWADDPNQPALSRFANRLTEAIRRVR